MSKPIVASKYSLCSIVQDLHDVHTFAPLESRLETMRKKEKANALRRKKSSCAWHKDAWCFIFRVDASVASVASVVIRCSHPCIGVEKVHSWPWSKKMPRSAEAKKAGRPGCCADEAWLGSASQGVMDNSPRKKKCKKNLSYGERTKSSMMTTVG